jgi:hypothetical protein
MSDAFGKEWSGSGDATMGGAEVGMQRWGQIWVYFNIFGERQMTSTLNNDPRIFRTKISTP